MSNLCNGMRLTSMRRASPVTRPAFGFGGRARAVRSPESIVIRNSHVRGLCIYTKARYIYMLHKKAPPGRPRRGRAREKKTAAYTRHARHGSLSLSRRVPSHGSRVGTFPTIYSIAILYDHLSTFNVLGPCAVRVRPSAGPTVQLTDRAPHTSETRRKTETPRCAALTHIRIHTHYSKRDFSPTQETRPTRARLASPSIDPAHHHGFHTPSTLPSPQTWARHHSAPPPLHQVDAAAQRPPATIPTYPATPSFWLSCVWKAALMSSWYVFCWSVWLLSDTVGTWWSLESA